MRYLMVVLMSLLLTACGSGSSSSSDNNGSRVDASQALLVPVENSEQFAEKIQAGLSDGLLETRVAFDAIAMSSTAEANPVGFTTTYTLEPNIDEHDFAKYDGEHLFIAPSNSQRDTCCVVIFDDAIESSNNNTDTADASITPPTESSPRSIRILATDAANAEASEVSSIALENGQTVEGLYVDDGQLAAISVSGWWGVFGDAFRCIDCWREQTTELSLYDISDVNSPTLDWHLSLEGGFVSSRKKGDIVYLVARHTPSISGWKYSSSETVNEENQVLIDNLDNSSLLLPAAKINGITVNDVFKEQDCLVISEQHVLAPANTSASTMTMIVAVNIAEKSIVNTACYLESTAGIYVSENAIYLTQSVYTDSEYKTLVHRFSLSESLAYIGSGAAQGLLGGSGDVDFRINEYKGYLRLVTSNWTDNNNDRRDHYLSVLDVQSDTYDMAVVATLPNEQFPADIGKPNEDLYGVRFFGDTLYLVTFERTDPLYVLDLTQATNPMIMGELEVTGFSDFLHPISDELLLGLGQDEEGFVKLELFNVEDFNDPYSLSAMSLGAEGTASTSSARYNRHAFTYQIINDSSDRFSVPVRINSLSDHQYQLFLFSLDKKDTPHDAEINAIGRIKDNINNSWRGDRQRAFFNDDSVYFINDDDVWSTLWSEPNTQKGPF